MDRVCVSKSRRQEWDDTSWSKSVHQRLVELSLIPCQGSPPMEAFWKHLRTKIGVGFGQMIPLFGNRTAQVCSTRTWVGASIILKITLPQNGGRQKAIGKKVTKNVQKSDQMVSKRWPKPKKMTYLFCDPPFPKNLLAPFIASTIIVVFWVYFLRPSKNTFQNKHRLLFIFEVVFFASRGYF